MPFEASAADEQAWNASALAALSELPLARVWTWPKPAIVLGRAQLGRLESVRAAAGPDIEIVVRSSGGGAVLAGPWMIGASVVLPPGHRLLGKSLVDAYHWLGQAYGEVLSRFGVPAELLAPERVAETNARVAGGPVDWACFGGLSPWELVDERGRKLVGLAQQRRRQGVLLVSGMLVRRPPWALLCRAMEATTDEQQLAARTTSVEVLSARPIGADAAQSMALALEDRVNAWLAG